MSRRPLTADIKTTRSHSWDKTTFSFPGPETEPVTPFPSTPAASALKKIYSYTFILSIFNTLNKK